MDALRRIAVLLALTLVCVARPRTTTAAADTFIVIVHPDSPVRSVDREFLRRAYLKKATEWSGGAAVRPIDLRTGHATRVRFTRDVLKKTPSQLRSYWNQQVFSGKGVPPPQASPEAVIEYVLANPGGVGYLPADMDPGGAKIIALE
jgi:ABC-type phosphate transport system substrate-binding protein